MSDFRLALRLLARQPTFTLLAVLTLALGIGAATAIFSVLNAVLLRPLPYPDANRLTMVWLANPTQSIDKDISPYPTFREFRAHSRAFSHLAVFTRTEMNLTGAGEPQRVHGAQVSAGFFTMLGVRPALGRTFRDDDHEPTRPAVAVIGHGLWSRAFGGHSSAVGKTLSLNGTLHTVIGIMPRGAAFPRGADFWVPLVPDGPSFEARGGYWLNVVGRLRPEIPAAAAAAELDAILRRLAKEFPQFYQGQSVVLESLLDSMVGPARTPLLVMQGAVLLLLLIACANVANLLFARGTARHREISIRAALGAGRSRVLRQLLTESLVLAALGSIAGLMFAFGGIEILAAVGPEDLPRLDDVRLDRVVFGFAAVMTLGVTLVFGVAPALQLAAAAPIGALKEGGAAIGSPTSSRIRSTLVAAQIALALVLLVGAGLLLRSYARVTTVEPGFTPDGVLTAETSLTRQRYPRPEHRTAFYATLVERLAMVPGVESAGAISTIFLSRLPNSSPIAIEGRGDLPEADRNLPVAFDSVTPDLFRVLRIAIVKGRGFRAADDAKAPRVAIVNEALVRRFFPRASAVGHRITFDDPSRLDARWITIVGVARDARRSGLHLSARPEVYVPYPQQAQPSMVVAVRGRGDPMALASAVRRTLAAIDPELPIARLATLETLVDASLVDRRFNMVLLTIFSLLAVSLAGIGTYGVASYTVANRTREFGVRLALGAARGHVLRLVIVQGIRMALAGAAIGVVGALALTRLLSSLLYEVSPTDGWTFAAVTVILAGVALTACCVPAWRAARIDPTASLRAE